jgi:predicted nucleotide-binding protein
VILQEQPNAGRTLIEKFEKYADVGYAVIIMTPDDVGATERAVLDAESADRPLRQVLRHRARQNVVLELGYFIGRLERHAVCALTVGDIEIPSDYNGVGFIHFDDADGWQIKLLRELREAGLPLDAGSI